MLTDVYTLPANAISSADTLPPPCTQSGCCNPLIHRLSCASALGYSGLSDPRRKLTGSTAAWCPHVSQNARIVNSWGGKSAKVFPVLVGIALEGESPVYWIELEHPHPS